MGGEDRGKPYEFKFFQGHIWTNVMADVEFDVDRTLRSRSPVRSPDWILALCWSDPYNLSTTVLKVTTTARPGAAARAEGDASGRPPGTRSKRAIASALGF